MAGYGEAISAMLRGAAHSVREPSDADRLISVAAHKQSLTVDEALAAAGGWGRYQQRLMGTLGACTAAAAVHMLQARARALRRPDPTIPLRHHTNTGARARARSQSSSPR